MQFPISHFLKRNKLIFLLGALACLFYFYLLHKLGSFDFVRDSLFSTEDSLEYQSYADWLSGQGGYSTPKRTFLYPLLILVSGRLVGDLGIWIFQFLFWLAGTILVFRTALNLSGRKGFAVLSFVLAASNVSLIVYTAHALTETSTFFLLSLLMYLLSIGYQDYKKPLIWSGLIFTISALAALRPVFQIIWYIWMVVSIVLIFKSVVRKPALILLIVLASSPVVIQKAINNFTHGTLSSTSIADTNLKSYFYRKVKFHVEATDGQDFNALPDSVHERLKAQVDHEKNSEIINYLFQHPVATISVYWDNIDENLKAGNPFIDQKTNRSLYKWTKNTSHNFTRFIHLFMTIVWLYYIAAFFRKREKQYPFILIGGVILFYILYTTGLVYWAGDRLVAPVIAIWAVLFPLLIHKFVSRLQKPGKRQSR